MTPLPQGARVALRFFEPGDQDALQAYLNLPGLAGRRYLPEPFPADLPLSADLVAEILEEWRGIDRQMHLAVALREEGSLIGHASAMWHWDPLCPDAALVISPEFQRRGLGSEAFGLLLDWVFDSLPANNISAWAADWNLPGAAFLRGQGMLPAGKERRSGYRAGKFYDMLCFDVLRSEWSSKKSRGHGA